MTESSPTASQPISRLAGLDRVLLAIGLTLAALTVAVPVQAWRSLAFTAGSLAFIAPYFLLSVALAAAISATGADGQIARVLRGRPAMAILLAAAFGAVSPLCSVSVIPIMAALLAAGTPLAPVMAFWIASPLMDPEMFVLTAAIIDVPFALARALSALALGLVAGCSTHLLRARPWAARPLDPGFDPARAGSVWSARCEAPAGGAADPVVWAFWRAPERRAVFAAQCRAIGWFLLRWLTLAFLVESLMVAYIPAGSVARLLGGGDWWAVPVSAAVGIPAYLNGYAAIPAVSALLDMGMRPGAALAFMTAGEVTSIPTALSVFVIVRRPVFALYLGLGLLGALLAGFGYEAWLTL